MQDKNKILLIFREKNRNGLDVCVVLTRVLEAKARGMSGPNYGVGQAGGYPRYAGDGGGGGGGSLTHQDYKRDNYRQVSKYSHIHRST